MSEEIIYIDEAAPFTEEQWDRIIGLAAANRWLASLIQARLDGRNVEQGIIATRQFHDSMNAIQAYAGTTSEDLLRVSSAMLAMAPQSDEETPE